MTPCQYPYDASLIGNRKIRRAGTVFVHLPAEFSTVGGETPRELGPTDDPTRRTSDDTKPQFECNSCDLPGSDRGGTLAYRRE